MKRLSQVPRRYIVAVVAVVVEISLAFVWLAVRQVRRPAIEAA